MKNIFICGESYIGYTVHIKGADTMATSGYFENVGWLRAALEAAGYHVDYMPSHAALEAFPDTAEKLDRYDLVILSDVGANTLMMTKKSFRESLPAPDRCKALRAYVERGGALVMVGGFMSFTGIEGKARYGVTPIADAERGEVLATINGDPFVAVGKFGEGRSVAFTSDCAPHWAPPSFLSSPDYGKLWKNIADWAARK